MKKTIVILMVISFATHTFAYDFTAVAPSGQTMCYSYIIGVSGCVSCDGLVTEYGVIYPNGALTIPDSVTYNGNTYKVISIGDDAFPSLGLTSVIIPNTVTAIGSGAFYNCSSLTSVTIGDSVTSIGDFAFFNCSSLTTLTIPNSVTNIGFSAFSYCSNLTNVSLGEFVTSIDDNTFKFCSSLASIIIPNSVTNIGESAFEYCSSLSSVIIGDSVTDIGERAFHGCEALSSVTIPKMVTNIGDEAFSWCSELVSIVVDSENTIYDSRDSCNAIIKTTNNMLMHGCKNTIIPNTVIRISNRAFFQCYGLTSITIPDSVIYIGDYAFELCHSLTSVLIGNSVGYIGRSAFNGCENLSTVTMGCSVTEIDDYAFDNCSNLDTIFSYATIAPNLGTNAFMEYGPGSTYLHTYLFVPCGSKSSYQNAWHYASYFYGPRFIVSELLPNTYTISTADTIMGDVITLTAPSCTSSVTVIRAVANYGYQFVQWNDGNTDNPRTFMLTQDTHFTAYFATNQYTITVNAAEYGTATGGGTYYFGDTITILAIPADNYQFIGWQDGNTENPRMVIVTGNATYTAYFESTQGIVDIDVDEIKIYSKGGRIVVQGAEGVEARVYDLTGREVVRPNQNGETPVLPSGVYLVKVGTLPARKVVVMR